MKSDVFEVTLLNWQKHNPKWKSGYKYFSISKDFFEDIKVQRLRASEALLLVWLIGRTAKAGAGHCLCTHEALPRHLRGTGKALVFMLTRLQQIQILTFKKVNLLLEEEEKEEEKEKEREEEKEEEDKKHKKGKEKSTNPTEIGFDPSPKKHSKKIFDHPLVEIWNTNRKALPQVVVINASRLKKCQQIFSSLTEPQWVEVVSRLAGSEFCNGKNDRGWIANFDFFLRPETGPKALEGAYDNREKFRHDFQKNADGFYLTNAEKNSYNNQLRLKRALEDLSESEAREKEINPNQGEIFEGLKNVNS